MLCRDVVPKPGSGDELKRRYTIAAFMAAGAGLIALALVGREPRATMHEDDWWSGEGNPSFRYYKSTGHFLHHLGELTTLTVPAFESYVMRAIEPTFREQIMLVTAMANDCPG